MKTNMKHAPHPASCPQTSSAPSGIIHRVLLLCFLTVQFFRWLSVKLHSPLWITAFSKERLSEEVSAFLFLHQRSAFCLFPKYSIISFVFQTDSFIIWLRFCFFWVLLCFWFSLFCFFRKKGKNISVQPCSVFLCPWFWGLKDVPILFCFLRAIL